MWKHTKRVSQSYFHHIHAFRHIRSVLDKSTAAETGKPEREIWRRVYMRLEPVPGD